MHSIVYTRTNYQVNDAPKKSKLVTGQLILFVVAVDEGASCKGEAEVLSYKDNERLGDGMS